MQDSRGTPDWVEFIRWNPVESADGPELTLTWGNVFFGYSTHLTRSGRAFVGEATSYTDVVGETVTRAAVRLDPVSCP